MTFSERLRHVAREVAKAKREHLAGQLFDLADEYDRQAERDRVLRIEPSTTLPPTTTTPIVLPGHISAERS